MAHPEPPSPSPGSPADEIVRRFVDHWGGMARAWGINATMGQIFGLLYLTGTEWTADDLCERLAVSRGNVSMNLRELVAWGVVHRVNHPGERREFFRAEGEVGTLFRRIARERKRRELDPTLALLDDLTDSADADDGLLPYRDRLVALRQFFGLVETLAERFASTEVDPVGQVRALLADEPPTGPRE